ncbi:MAG: choice-of-anchor tandem repeat NxxGxxAF-containing protein, partial [Planctomycetota bacterium]
MRTLIHAIAAAALAGLALGQPVMTKLTYGRPGQDASAFGTDLTFPGFCRNGVAIGDDGRVIFSTQLAGPGTTVSNDWALGWTDGSTASKIARTGETLPGVPGGLNLGRASINNAGFAEVHMSDLGEVSFTSVLLVNGAWRTTLFAGPSTQPAFVMGAQFPTPGVAGNPTLAAIGTPLHMNSGGLVALDARPFQRGEYLMTADEGSQIAWVYEGDPAPLFTPPTSWSYKEGVQINDNNEIGFQGLLTASSVIRQQREVLYAGPPNQLRIVARSGFPAPDLPNTTYGRFINSNNFQAFSRGHWRIADDNVIAFSTPTTGLVDGAIFLGLFGDVRLYRADGQQAPDLPAGVLLDGLGESHVELNG